MKLERKFNGLPIREARASLHVQPSKKDIEGATREDPTNCAYARALKRTLECKHVFVYKSIAYIETLDERGNPIMERYAVRQYAQEYLLRFDGGQRIEPGGFVFHKPSPCRTLDYKVKEYRRNKGKRSHARLGGEASRPKTYSLRNGKGQVHFTGIGTISKHEEKT